MGMRVSRADLQRLKAERRGQPPPLPTGDGAPRAPAAARAPHERVTFGKTGPSDIHALAARLEAVADGAMRDAAVAVKGLVGRVEAFERDFADAQARITRLEAGLSTALGRVREREETTDPDLGPALETVVNDDSAMPAETTTDASAPSVYTSTPDPGNRE